MKAIGVGDLHLDKNRLTSIFGPGVLDLQMDALKNCYKYAGQEGIKHVILLGDVADEPYLSDRSKAALIDLLISAGNRGFVTHIILGNHDVEQKYVNSLHVIQQLSEGHHGLIKGLHIYSEPTEAFIEGVPVDFLPFPYTEPLRPNSLVIAHLERPGALRDNGHKIAEGHGIEEHGDGNVFWSGHLHTPQVLGSTWFSGTLYQTNAGESPEKAFLHGEFSFKGGKLRHKTKHVKVVPDFQIHKAEIHHADDLDQISDNPLHKVIAYYDAAADLPPSWLSSRPNIFESWPFKDKHELRLMITPERVDYTLTEGLSSYLEQRGMVKRQIRRAERKVKRASSKLGINLG